MRGRIFVYLDMNYWIRLKENKKLYDVLYELVMSNRITIAISELVFYEATKHNNPQVCKDTLQLIQQFKPVCLADRNTILEFEFEAFLNQESGPKVIRDSNPVWTAFPFALFPDLFAGSNHEAFTISAFREFMAKLLWDIPLCDYYCLISKDKPYRFSYEDNVKYFNEKKLQYRHENKSFDELLMSEIGGIVDLFDPIYERVLVKRYTLATGRIPSKEELADFDFKWVHNLIFHAFKLKRITDQLPTFRIGASLHANSRWNLTKKHHRNDTVDFGHASYALPHCELFFTERSLATALTQKNMQLDKLFQCEVLYDEKAIVNRLQSI